MTNMQFGDGIGLAAPRPVVGATEGGPPGQNHVHGLRVDERHVECETRSEISKPHLTDMQFGDGSDYTLIC
jgi:hypothetical protein